MAFSSFLPEKVRFKQNSRDKIEKATFTLEGFPLPPLQTRQAKGLLPSP
jgi:hypothetical protein